VKPLALDLFCGKGGWTQGLLDTGWDVLGIDIEDMGGYPEGARLVLADVLEVAKDAVAWVAQHDPRPVSLVTASPPCQEFSYSSFPFRLAREKFTPENPPDKSLWRAAESIAKQLGAPLILENVRGAVKWMGPAVNRFGPFYL
jgi:site-specific DNA-cytosine methylase